MVTMVSGFSNTVAPVAADSAAAQTATEGGSAGSNFANLLKQATPEPSASPPVVAQQTPSQEKQMTPDKKAHVKRQPVAAEAGANGNPLPVGWPAAMPAPQTTLLLQGRAAAGAGSAVAGTVNGEKTAGGSRTARSGKQDKLLQSAVERGGLSGALTHTVAVEQGNGLSGWQSPHAGTAATGGGSAGSDQAAAAKKQVMGAVETGGNLRSEAVALTTQLTHSAASGVLSTAADARQHPAQGTGGSSGSSTAAAFAGTLTGVLNASGVRQAATGVPSNTAKISAPLGSAAFDAALGQHLLMMAGNGTPTARIHLTPAELGPIAVEVRLLAQNQVAVTMMVSHSQTHQVLQQSLVHLQEAFQAQGMQLQTSLSGGQGNGQQAPGREEWLHNTQSGASALLSPSVELAQAAKAVNQSSLLDTYA